MKRLVILFVFLLTTLTTSSAFATVCGAPLFVHSGIGSAIYLGLASSTLFAPEGQIGFGVGAVVNEEPLIAGAGDQDPSLGNGITGRASGRFDGWGIDVLHHSRTMYLDGCNGGGRSATSVNVSMEISTPDSIITLAFGAGPQVGIDSTPEELLIGAAAFVRLGFDLPLIILEIEGRPGIAIAQGEVATDLIGTARVNFDIPFPIKPVAEFDYGLSTYPGSGSGDELAPHLMLTLGASYVW